MIPEARPPLPRPRRMVAGEPRVLFVNSGLLGQRTFATFVQRSFLDAAAGIDAAQVIVSDGLSLRERVVRRAVCQRIWPDVGIRNLDLFRFRAEWHAGLVARRRIAQLERAGRRFDVLHFHRQATAYASLARMRRTPAIVSIDCTQRCVIEHARSGAEAWTYLPNVRRDGAVFDAARLIVATSRWTADSVRTQYPGCRTEIRVMRPPVPLDLFDRGWIEERHRRAADPEYRPRALFVGGDFPRKGGLDLLRAWREGGFGARAVLDVVSAWPIDRSLLSEGVAIHAAVSAHSPEWVDLWRRADVFVMPTHEDAFGLVFQEAAAAGLPAIGTRIMAVPELIADGESGLLIPPGDVASLADALAQLFASADVRRSLGTRARAEVERDADPSAYRDDLVAAIRRLAH